MSEKTVDVAEMLKGLSVQDFLAFGVHDIAYIKQIEVDDEIAYAVHAADGTPLSVIKELQEAEFLIQDKDLSYTTVQ